MGQIHCQVRIPHKSLISHDDVINTFTFVGIDEVEDQATIALGKLKAFYNDLSGTQTESVKNYMSGELNFGGTRLKVYDIQDPEPRVPILEESLGVTAASPISTSNLPAEVALVLSYKAEAESGVHAARRRGRIFLGPLCTGVGTSSTGTTNRPITAALTNIGKAASELSSGPLGTQWCVWSRKNHAFYPIVEGYLDNAFDTQRRRGADPTNRVGWEGGFG